MEANNQQQQTGTGSILIVDDSPVMQMHLKSMLCKMDYEVHVAALGREACILAKEVRPHLILLDVNLPDMSGYDVCKEIKEDDKTSDIPIVFVTGLSDVDDRVKGLQLGAVDYISEPVEKQILLTKADIFVRLCRDGRMLKKMHAELMASHAELEQFSLALDNASDGVVITDPAGVITYVNLSFELLARYSPKSESDRLVNGYFTDQNVLSQIFVAALAGISTSVEIMLKRGSMELPVMVRGSAILDSDRVPKGIMLLVIDQTERKKSDSDRKRLEIELYHSQKLESVGQLAAGIAHEINTPVQFIGDNIHFMQDSIQDLFVLHQAQDQLLEAAKNGGVAPAITDAVDQARETADLEYLKDELPRAISQSLEGVDRVGSIVRAMKEFAHPGASEKAPANLNEAIQTTITVARNKWKYVASLETDFDDNLPMVPCLVSEFNQVILNLIVNACDAISDVVGDSGEMGRINISTRLTGNYVEVRIQDTGGGIPEKIQSRIFDPFFTTKEVGKGSGQGLAIAHGVIINKHQGEFLFETEEGQGTTFIIQLPLEEAA